MHRLVIPLSIVALLAGCALLDTPRRGTTGSILRDRPRDMAIPAALDSLRVVSWNIQYSQRIDTALEEIEAIPHLKGADVYLLQEIDTEAAARLVRTTGLAGAHYSASVRTRSGRELGNLVLSRWPIVGARRVDLPHGGGLRGAPRSATVVDLKIAATRVRVVSIHTSIAIVSPDERIDQARTALMALGDFAGPTVIAGDFNTVERGDDLALRALLRDYDFDWVFPGTDTTVDTMWKEVLLPHDRLDHVFVRGFAVRSAGVVPDTDASDHLPQWVVMAWPPRIDAEGALR